MFMAVLEPVKVRQAGLNSRLKCQGHKSSLKPAPPNSNISCITCRTPIVVLVAGGSPTCAMRIKRIYFGAEYAREYAYSLRPSTQ